MTHSLGWERRADLLNELELARIAQRTDACSVADRLAEGDLSGALLFLEYYVKSRARVTEIRADLGLNNRP